MPPPPNYVIPVQYDALTHQVKEGIPLLTDGVYNQVWDVLGYGTYELEANLEQSKKEQHRKLDNEFKQNEGNNVVSQTITWKGGYDSASRINNKTLIMEYNNDTTGVIYDIDDEPHLLSLSEIKQISYDIAIAYEATYVSYQTRNKDIKNARNQSEVQKDYVW